MSLVRLATIGVIERAQDARAWVRRSLMARDHREPESWRPVNLADDSRYSRSARGARIQVNI